MEQESDKSDLPILYRLILKFPKLSLENYPSWFYGVFWVIVLPCFVILDGLINFLFLICLIFPFNLFAFFIFNTLVSLLALRILVERSINAKKIYAEKSFRWNLEDSLEDYIEMLRKTRFTEKSESQESD